MEHSRHPADTAEAALRWWPVSPRWSRLVPLVSVGYLALWTLFDLAASHFEALTGVSVWYPPPGLDLALLLVLGLRWWPLLVASSAVHVLVVSPGQMDALADAVYVAVTAGGYVAAAAVLLRVLHVDPRLPTQRDVVALVAVAAGAAALVVCVVRVGLLTVVGVVPPTSLVLSVGSNWAGSATGIAMLTPVLLLAARRWVGAGPGSWPSAWTTRPPLPRSILDPASPTESAAQAAALVAAVWLAYSGIPGNTLDYTYLVYAPLLWIAARGGLGAAAGAVLAANVLAVLLSGERTAPADGGIALQFGLVTLSVAGLLLGAHISQRRRDVEAHRHASMHDALTGLANRALFDERLASAMSRAHAGAGEPVGVLFCDLDDFKQVNDSLGHAAGDQVLVEAGRRLEGAVRVGDTVARLGGDEFAVVLDGLEDDAALTAVAAQITSSLAVPHRLDAVHDRVVVTVSTGSASTADLPAAEPAARDGALLVRDADVALNRAKQDGRARHVSFDAAMHASAVGRLESETALRRALAEGDISVVYQPIIDLDDGAVVAAEALARWTTPAGEDVPPAEFTVLAETTGLIATLGTQVRERAVADAATWDRAGQPRLSLNVSGAEVADAGFADDLLDLLGRTGLPASAVAVELTETVLVAQSPVCVTNLDTLADAGVDVVIDDFGAGFSSFAYVRRLPISMLKIDQSFVSGLPGCRTSAAIVRAILAMAAELGLRVVAEGITTPEQRVFLREHGCRYGQGFALGGPDDSAALVRAALSAPGPAPTS